MADLLANAVWAFFSIYMILTFMAFWLIDEAERRTQCLRYLRRGFLIVIALWVGIAVLVGVLASIVSGVV
jgi:hypothetical protein